MIVTRIQRDLPTAGRETDAGLVPEIVSVGAPGEVPIV